jgi:hypothetical protein
MAEDFKALVAAQKETSKLIQQQIRNAMSDEERAAADAVNEAKSEAARRGWETRQENNALVAAESAATTAGKDEATGQEQLTIFQKIGKFLRVGGAAQEEDNSKKKIKGDQQLSMLGRISKSLGDGFKDTKEKAGKGLMGMLKAGLFGGLILAGVAFLNSPYFGMMMKVIKEDIIPVIATIYTDFIKPIAIWFGGALLSFFKNLGKLVDLIKGDEPFMEKIKKLDMPMLGAALTAIAGLGLAFVAFFKGGIIAKVVAGLAKIAAGGVKKIFKGGAAVASKLLPGASKVSSALPDVASKAKVSSVPKGGGKIAGAAKGLATMGKAAGKSIGAFIGGILKGIASGLAAFANPAALAGLLAVTVALKVLEDTFEPIGKFVESVGKAIKSTFEGIGEVVGRIGDSVGTIITKMGDSIGAVVDKISGMSTAGTDATTKQIKELSKIPAEPMLAVAKGINAMKKALDGFGGGTLSKIGDSLFGSGGPIEKIIDLTKKVPELMKAAEAITVLSAAGSDFAKTEAELKRRKRVTELSKDIASGDVEGSDTPANIAKAKKELATLQGQAMKMDAVGSGGTSGVGLKRIEKLVTEIVMMKREQQKNASAGTTFNKGGDQTTVNQGKTIVTQPTPIANPSAVAKQVGASG